MIVVYFTGSTTGCTYKAFLLLASDAYIKETYALLLTAQTTGQQIKYDHSYCHASGYARSNQYSIVN